jgi:hypothetical protein
MGGCPEAPSDGASLTSIGLGVVPVVQGTFGPFDLPAPYNTLFHNPIEMAFLPSWNDAVLIPAGLVLGLLF